MDTFLAASATFDATHSDEVESPYLHGHTFTVTVHELADASGLCASLQQDLEQVVRPLHLHTLSEMLYGGKETLDGIATWVMERLLMNHPHIVRAEVATSSSRAIVERTVR